MRVFYSPSYVIAKHAFDTTRKARWVAESLQREPVAGVEIVEPAPLSEAQLLAVHAPEYVNAIRTGEPRELAESQGFEWDEGLWRMVLASNGGAVAAALAAMEDGVAGSLSSGLHHARRAHGAGYCTFNGLAIAAREALAAGARSVLILDLDAHCGGGTASLIDGDARIRQVDVSVDAYDRYDGSAQSRLELVRRAEDYLPAVQRALDALDEEHATFDLCIYNAGMDPCELCETGGLAGITAGMLAERERVVFEWCRRRGLPVAFVLAGGYSRGRLGEAALVALHRLTVDEAAR